MNDGDIIGSPTQILFGGHNLDFPIGILARTIITVIVFAKEH